MTLQNNLMQKSTGGVNPTYKPVAGIGSARAPIRPKQTPTLDLPDFSAQSEALLDRSLTPAITLDPFGTGGKTLAESLVGDLEINQSNIIVGAIGLALIVIALIQIVKPI